MPDSAPPLALHLDLREPHRRLVSARLRFVPQRAIQRLRWPAWTPGSYLIRDYVRTLEGLEAWQDGRQLPLERLEPACWQLSGQATGTEPRSAIELRWRILATELSVRTCHLDADHGFLALAGVVPLLEGERWTPWQLTLSLPADWQAFLPLPADGQGGWRARHADELIDSPLEVGPHPCHAFTVAGVPHRWVSWGGDLPRLDPAWLADVEQVCRACCQLMGEERPAAPQYLFVLHLLEQGYGGLEHDQASVLQFGRRTLRGPEGRRKLLQLVAHEYLHQWNVRRLRPAQLTPIDYNRPVVVPSLWFAEGVTSYYDQLLPHAAGLSSEEELLSDLGADLSRYSLTPGRAVQSLRQSSQEAWVKLYRPEPHSPDNQVSYYLKGAVLALVLDLHLRRHGSALALVLRQLWQSHGRSGRGYEEADLLAAFTDHAADLSTFLPFWLESEEDPPLNGYLADIGLRLVATPSPQRHAGWCLGAASGSPTVSRVLRGGPAETAGLAVGDELLALDGQRLRNPEEAASLLADVQEGQPLPLLFCRDGRVRHSQLVPGPAMIERWTLQIDPQAGEEATAARTRWRSLLP